MKPADLARAFACAAIVCAASPSEARFLQVDPVGYQDQINLYAYVGDDPLNKTDPTGKDSWLVARPVYYFGIHVGDHMFVVVSDKPGGKPTAEFHYGPQNSGSVFNPGKLVSLTNTNTETARTDSKAWSSLSNNSDSGVHSERIPASDASVIAAGQDMNRTLGTPSNPGPVDYVRTPDGSTLGANSNSAAASIANNAVQAERPGAPIVNPPAGANTPGSSVNINKSGCVSGSAGATCKM